MRLLRARSGSKAQWLLVARDTSRVRKKATPEELEYWRKVARDSAILEKETSRGTPEQRARVLQRVNERRQRDGIPPLLDEDDDPPELEFYRIARARGLLRRPEELR